MRYDMVACGQRIQALRRQSKISQARMSEILAISTVHLSNVERGINGASVELLVDMAIHFNVSLDYLILGNPNPTHDITNKLDLAIELLTSLKEDVLLSTEAG